MGWRRNANCRKAILARNRCERFGSVGKETAKRLIGDSTIEERGNAASVHGTE